MQGQLPNSLDNRLLLSKLPRVNCGTFFRYFPQVACSTRSLLPQLAGGIRSALHAVDRCSTKIACVPKRPLRAL